MLIRVHPPRTGPEWWLWRQVEDLQQKVYGAVASHDQSLSPVTYAWLQGRRVVATLDVLSKEISHVGHDYRASGLSWVLTDPEARHHGHGRDLISAVRDEISRQPVERADFAHARIPLYPGTRDKLW